MFLPVGASISLLVMFFFFDSMQMVFAVCTAGMYNNTSKLQDTVCPFSLARYEACALDGGNNTLVTALVSPACLDGKLGAVLLVGFEPPNLHQYHQNYYQYCLNVFKIEELLVAFVLKTTEKCTVLIKDGQK